MCGYIKLRISPHLSHADRNLLTEEFLLKPKFIHPHCVKGRNIANRKDVTHMFFRKVLTAQPVPTCGKASSSPSKQLLKIYVLLKGHLAGINRPVAYPADRVTPNLSYVL